MAIFSFSKIKAHFLHGIFATLKLTLDRKAPPCTAFINDNKYTKMTAHGSDTDLFTPNCNNKTIDL